MFQVTKYLKVISFMLIILSSNSTFAREITIARGNGEYPPNEMHIDGVLTGFHIELEQAVFKNMDLAVKFVSVPWSRALLNMKNNIDDAITYVGKNEERAEYIIFDRENIISNISFAIYTRKGEEAKLNTYADISKLSDYPGKILGLLGYSYGPLDAYEEKMKRVREIPQLVTLLLNKRFDLAVFSMEELKYMYKDKPELKELVILEGHPYNVTDVYLGFSKKKENVDLSKRFGIELNKFKASDNYKALQKKYGGA
jgi:polar amino acid transport system substrate-binding protein